MMPPLSDAEARQTLRQIAWRLIPFLGLLYITAYLDRINISFAALQMNQDLKLSAAAYGTGAGLFFLGYVLFEIPSNLILQRVGPRLWIARIMLSWGLISTGMALVRDETSFYVLRFLLGVAEAGFFPGIILYLTYWFPARERARTIANFATATALAGLIGSPLSGAILEMDGLWGWRGWHWLFVLEGLPTVLLGLVALAQLPDRPEQARWLTVPQRDWLNETLRREQEAASEHSQHTLGEALASGRVWLLGLIYLCMVIGMYGIGLWLPQMLRALTAADDFTLGLLNALPFLAATVGMVLIGRHSDSRNERPLHVAGSLALAATWNLAGGVELLPANGAAGVFAGGSRGLGGHGTILGAGDLISKRCSGSGRDRADQLAGQCRRLSRPIPDGLAQADDGWLQRRLINGRGDPSGWQQFDADHPFLVRNPTFHRRTRLGSGPGYCRS
jgi:ACS family tartrate transporter-like MFS transporter